MKKLVLCTFMFIFTLHTHEKRNIREHRSFLQRAYKNISGFSIDMEEINSIEKIGSNATYGEITDKAVEQLIKKLNLTKHDVFYDLGCGVGRMVVQMYLESPVKKSVGIELSETRYNHAMSVLKQLIEKKLLQPNRDIDFFKQDFLTFDISDATVIYFASTCFSDELIQKTTAKMSKLKKGLRVITLRQLPQVAGFSENDVKTYSLPMTWCEDVPVYVYTLQD